MYPRGAESGHTARIARASMCKKWLAAARSMSSKVGAQSSGALYASGLAVQSTLTVRPTMLGHSGQRQYLLWISMTAKDASKHVLSP